jgi:hypothetical protein
MKPSDLSQTKQLMGALVRINAFLASKEAV